MPSVVDYNCGVFYMNELVVNLFHRAGGSIRIVNGATWHYTDEGFDMEKFAELIVSECSRVADQWVNDEDNGTNLVSEKLKQHFGVGNE